MTVPHLPGVISADEIVESGAHLARLQTASGMIPWWPDGHCDPWNHVESAMALDVAGFHTEAARAYEWLADTQRPDGSWHNYYRPDGECDDTVDEAKIDTNVVAYVATGVWHHWKTTCDLDAVTRLWPTVERALDFVLDHRRDDGLVLWAVEADGTRTWDYALLTGSCSIQHALRCGVALASLNRTPRPDWESAAEVITDAINERPEAFEPKQRWAMDWYYPALSRAVTGDAAKRLLADGWATFAMDGLGIRCVSDEPWVTASETAEAALAFAAIGDVATARDLLSWTRGHRQDDGSYLTGVVHPERIVFPVDEHTSYTAAAVLLAADAIAGTGPASEVFVPRTVRAR